MARFFSWGPRLEGRFDEAGWAAFLDGLNVVRRLVSEFPGGSGDSLADAVALVFARADDAAAAAAAEDDAPVASADTVTAPVASASTLTASVAIFGPTPPAIGDADSDDSGGGSAVAIMSAPARPGHALGAPTLADSGRYVILFGEGLEPALVVDMDKREIVGDGFENQQLGAGSDDVLVLAGGLAPEAVLPQFLNGLENVVVQEGASYSIVSPDDQVAAGATLAINAGPLDAGDSIHFDGSAETDGSFAFLGGGGGDTFLGGAGNDRIEGGGGGDSLTGGGGADLFAYLGAADSSGAGYDSLLDFDAGADRIDLPVAVSGFGEAIEGGSLSAASFDEDLAAALGEDGLGAGRAVLFTPDAGDLAGTLFLIVDGNGEAGYQAGEDFVFALPNADPADLGNTGIFV
jgi:Ca2+-binding RTX toxin-like protein